MRAAANKRRLDALSDANLAHLIDDRGEEIGMDDLRTLAGLLTRVRQGFTLTATQTAKVSSVRAEIARSYRHDG